MFQSILVSNPLLSFDGQSIRHSQLLLARLGDQEGARNCLPALTNAATGLGQSSWNLVLQFSLLMFREIRRNQVFSSTGQKLLLCLKTSLKCSFSIIEQSFLWQAGTPLPAKNLGKAIATHLWSKSKVISIGISVPLALVPNHSVTPLPLKNWRHQWHRLAGDMPGIKNNQCASPCKSCNLHQPWLGPHLIF